MTLEESEILASFTEVTPRVFHVNPVGGAMTIGGKPITPDMRNILREQAKFIQTSQLWELLDAATINEAVNLGLIQSKDFGHVQFAKAMLHYSNFIQKIVNKLAEK